MAAERPLPLARERRCEFETLANPTTHCSRHFVTQRALYEVRERPSKTYSWKAFMFANIMVELPWNSLMAVIIFFCFYYPIGLYQNAVPTDAVHLRGAQFFLFVLEFLLFTSSFTNMMIAGIADAETGGNLANLLFSLSLIFCGVLQTAKALPGFWIFMYRLSPFTYLVEGMLSTGIANTKVHCADNELVTFEPTGGATCAQYMDPYINGANGHPGAGGYLANPSATENCQFCTFNDSNVFLQGVGLSYSNAWRDFGILWAYIIFNIFAAVGIYWLARVPKKSKHQKKEDKKSA